MTAAYVGLIGVFLGAFISLVTTALQQFYAVKSKRKEIVRKKLEEMYHPFSSAHLPTR